MALKADAASGYRGAAVATLAAAVAGSTLLSGLIRLRLPSFTATPLIAVEPLPRGGWLHTWLPSLRSGSSLQAAALDEWLRLVLTLLVLIMAISAISALIALFAHATARRYEVALSAVVGATRAQLMRLQLGKAAINAALALAIGVVIGLLGALAAHRSWPHMSRGVSAGSWIILSALFAAAVAALVAHTTAARMARSGWLGDALAPEARSNPGFGAEDLRGVLLHMQFAFTFALLAVALLVRQHAMPRAAAEQPQAAAYVTRVEFDEHMTAAQRRALHRQLEARLFVDSGAYAVASPGALIGVGDSDQIISNCGRCVIANMLLPMFPLRTQQHVAGAGFFRAAGFRLMAGREFDARDANARHVVVNDTFANLAFQGQPALGRSIQVGGLQGDWYTVIGVIEDVPISALISFAPDPKSLMKPKQSGKAPAVYFNAAQKTPTVFDVVTNAPVQLQLAGVRVRSMQRMSDVISSARAPARWFGGVLGALSAAAAVIAVLSLAAITTLNTQQRRLEIAARRAVGARRRDILRMVLGSTLLTVARGVFVGVILSLALARVVQMVLPGLRLFDAGVLVGAATTLALVSLLAAAWPARAAARIAPAQVHH